MANWTKATLLKRLAVAVTETEDGAASLIDDPHPVLGEVLAADIIEQLKSEVVREAMKR
jgi:hypothetical protein